MPQRKPNPRNLTRAITLREGEEPKLRPSVTALLKAAGEHNYPDSYGKVPMGSTPYNDRERLLNNAARAYLARERSKARRKARAGK